MTLPRSAVTLIGATLFVALPACDPGGPTGDAAVPAARDASAPSTPTRVLPYDRAFYDLAAAGRFSGSVLVALPDTVFERSYRMAGAPEGAHVSSDLRYPIGEIAQVLLRAAYFRLADEGRLNLNAPVGAALPGRAGDSPFLPSGKTAGEVINYRMLLDHRAGLPEALRPGQPLRDLELASQPGIEERYSALGYDVLAKALSERLGQPIEEVLRVHVLEPAGMTQTGAFRPEDSPTFGNRAVGFTDVAGTPELLDLNAFGERGLAGGLPEYYSTIADLFYLAQWLPESAYLRGRITQPAVRPGYRGLFDARVDGSRVAVALSNFGGSDMRAARQILLAL